MTRVIGIGWYGEGVEFKDNYLAVSISENGASDLELLCANAISQTDNVPQYISDFISDVQGHYPGFEFIFSYYVSEFNSAEGFVKTLNVEINNRFPTIRIIKCENMEGSSYHNEVKSIYAYHSNLSEEEMKAAYLSLVEIPINPIPQ